MITADVHEIFVSIQGEGPWIGERHIFVRFAGCDLTCRYCDTPAAAQAGPDLQLGNDCRIQTASGISEYDLVPNPVSSLQLTAYCSRFMIPGPSRPTLSLTGGEPLLHASFLAEWLPQVRTMFRIYLETSGIHAAALYGLRDLIDVISMDFKLPSATGMAPFWEEHRKFLSAASGKTLFVKTVVTNETVREDILTSAALLSEFDTSIALIIQPASGERAPGPLTLMEFQDAALGMLENVRIIPQAHKTLNVP